ncbi:hypothetical protein [Flexithrix dorotheae]|uniref:hypothetical protein n=1 Tax=Flexithrix dorotheae TaxID=70993 RepID=UPI00035D9A0D|nr:hypothetical protein [Flexithrix dorotheae]
MNLIQKQADKFVFNKMGEDHRPHKDFIDEVRYECKRDSYKIVFLERVIQKAKIEYDEHLKICPNVDECVVNEFFENTLFFLQEDIEIDLEPEDFNGSEKDLINKQLQKILEEINAVKLGQQITYDDFSEDLKDLLFLKRNPC